MSTDPSDNVEVRLALAHFTETTGWFTADRNVHNNRADISLTAAQIRVLDGAMKIANLVRDFCADLEDAAEGDAK